ncbi:GNA1162 family protein [Teredinibacter haidensis]|uniref:GNA1162 family protein n=1 Tax=Teredinibacter haidensis TaxID=2731755 RepID=UPI000948ACB3|nr:GNA1162 family protein [Teredinibacter haidensis]
MPTNRLVHLTLLCVVFLLSGCETTSSTHVNRYQQAFDNASVRSILVLPVTNRSINISAPSTMLSVLPTILADRGYYVFPVNTVKVVLENEGLYEADEIHKLAPTEIANLFGADAVLYVSVERWDTRYVILSSTTEVTLEFLLVSHNGDELWRAKKTIEKSSKDNSSNSNNILAELIGDAISAAWERAFPDYRPLAMEASKAVFLYDGTRIPTGPYHPSNKHITEQQAEGERSSN